MGQVTVISPGNKQAESEFQQSVGDSVHIMTKKAPMTQSIQEAFAACLEATILTSTLHPEWIILSVSWSRHATCFTRLATRCLSHFEQLRHVSVNT